MTQVEVVQESSSANLNYVIVDIYKTLDKTAIKLRQIASDVSRCDTGYLRHVAVTSHRKRKVAKSEVQELMEVYASM